MNKKMIIALLFVVSMVILAACSQKSATQQPAKNMDQNPQPIDLGNGLEDASSVDQDLNVDDTSGDTDAAVKEIQTI